MNTTPRPVRLRHPSATAALLAALALAASSTPPLRAQSVGVTGFDDRGWNADDVRREDGVGVTNSTTHAPGSAALFDPDTVASLIDWRNTQGSFGNLGGVSFDGGLTGSGKSTLSVIDTDTGFASTAEALGADFQAAYRWQNTDTATPGISFKIGIQSTAWADSQNGFAAARSGEATWDLLLVYDPAQPPNTPGNSTTDGAFHTSTIDYETGVFYLFAQAGNAHFTAPGTTVAKTLAEWQADETWGALLFGDGAKITNTQFGMGSGNAGASGILDFASISYLQDGARIDFVDAIRHTGPGTDFGDAATWGGVAPDSSLNLVVEQDATLDVSGEQHARSLGVLSGETTLNLGPASTLTLDSAQNGTLSAAHDATLSVSGPGTLRAATIESLGTIDLAATVVLDGGATPHPIRDGTNPNATSRYGLVVGEGGVVNLLTGADVTMKNDTGENGLKTLVRVGETSGYSGPGVLNIHPGANLSLGSLHGTLSWGALHVGDWGAQGEVNQTGGVVDILGAINLGNEGGVGVYNLSDGEINIRRPVGDNGAFIIGRSTNLARASSGTLNVSGGTLTLGADGGTGSVVMILGGLSDNNAAYANATGLVHQTDGVVRFQNGALRFGRGTGTYNLHGGTLEIGGSNAISATTGGTYAFNLGGGMLKVVGANLSTGIDINVVDTNPLPGTGSDNVSTSIINTNGFNAALSGSLTGEGILVKAGLGTLTLSGDNNLTGETYVIGGSVHQIAGDSAINYLAVGSGTGMTGSFQMVDGSLDVAQALQVGDWGGTGSFDQTGGIITIGTSAVGASLNIGNQGGAGVYNLSGGTVKMVHGFANLGRSTQTGAAGDGELNISGTGVFEVGDQGDLIIGDRDGTGIEGNGVVNQSGGTLRVIGGGELWVGAYGHGAYNLSDGTLEIGGSSLVSNYGNGGGGGVFNLGGGTIRVIGSSLATAVRPVLVSAATSTIDTAGYDAVFSNGFSGDGALVKIGDGKLTVGANLATGSFTVAAGVAEFTGSAVGFQDVTLRSGAILAGAGDLALADGSTLTIEIGGVSDFGKVVVASTFDAADSILNIVFVDGYSPITGATFDVLDFAVFDGLFAQVNIAPVSGHYWNLSRLAEDGSFTLAAIPEPASCAALSALGALALASCRRRRRAH
mgnify:FL=1|jgi:autotransporter-associated beta strand repeat